MAMHHRTKPDATHEDILRRLVEAQGLREFAFFFVTGEGRTLPNGLEVTSGTVVDTNGTVHSFWTGWNEERNEPTLLRWREIRPDPHWLEDEEYREALDAVGRTP